MRDGEGLRAAEPQASGVGIRESDTVGSPDAGLHVAYLVQQFPPEVGAGPARVGEMIERWRDAGVGVTVLTGMPNRPHGRIYPGYRRRLFMEERWGGIRVLRSWLYASPRHGFVRTLVNQLTFMATSALLGLVRGGRPDVLIASSPPFFPHLSGLLIARLRRVPLVLEIRDLWPDYLVDMGLISRGWLSRFIFAIERYLLRQASHVVVVTESFRRRVVAKGVQEEKVSVITNGVDPQYYRPADDPPARELEGPAGELAFGYLGNVGAGQDLTSIIDAASALGRDWGGRVVLVGDGPQREHIERAIARLRSAKVTLHPSIPKERTRAFYNGCDVCLVPLAPLPVLEETIPSKIFEIMACGRPILASVGGETARIVRESGCGLVVPPGDADALARAAEELVALDVREREEMGARGRQYVIEHYGRDDLARRYLEILERTAVAS